MTATTPTTKSALILGATGATGKHLLRNLLASPHFSRVGEYGRRVTPADQLGGEIPPKLVQKTVDFEKIGEAGLAEGKWDVVFVTLGTTRKAAGSAEAFEKIDREYVINSARAAKSNDPSHSQRIVYCSSGGANASSSMLYMRSKGLTENGLAALGYADTIVFRPGYLKNAERGGSRLAETVLAPVMNALSLVSSSLQIDVEVLAKGMRLAGQLGSSALPPSAQASRAGPSNAQFTLIGNSGALALGKMADEDS
ncbi:hypothetical protein BD410DRAFT_783713 [Rickenella mellea]|uniref:NAD(P)-binding domain-containing protein n=1 Tax=Rickenella mellea TaxID=50990 RepID=A0A4Y7QGS8_9AGAM|nr:hypothetical protein BD410DRAFT_783713 [Rickenella mellea]